MNLSPKAMGLGALFLAVAAIPLSTTLTTGSFAQTQSPAAAGTAALPAATVKALQDALNSQGIAVKTDGVLNDETRAAIRKYQTQHHLPVTGEPDNATLSKLGVAVRQSEAPEGQSTHGQTATTGASPHTMGPQMMQGGMMPGGMMNCPMMQGQSGATPMQQGTMMANAQMMQGMMQMMQGMMRVMQSQMQPAQPPAAQ
jgi:hypothetical protein